MRRGFVQIKEQRYINDIMIFVSKMIDPPLFFPRKKNMFSQTVL